LVAAKHRRRRQRGQRRPHHVAPDRALPTDGRAVTHHALAQKRNPAPAPTTVPPPGPAGPIQGDSDARAVWVPASTGGELPVNRTTVPAITAAPAALASTMARRLAFLPFFSTAGSKGMGGSIRDSALILSDLSLATWA